jgi:hypothetical protein
MADKELRISEVPDGLVITGGRLDERRLDKEVVKKAADFVASHAAGVRGMGTYTGGRLTPSHDEIAELAFRLYEARDQRDGHDAEDWLSAEQVLVEYNA